MAALGYNRPLQSFRVMWRVWKFQKKNCPTYPLVQNISHIQVFVKSRFMAIKSTLSDWNSKHSWSVRVSRRETRGFVSGIFSMLDQIVLIPGEPLILRFSFPLLLLLIPLDKLWHIFSTTKTIVLQSSNPDSCFFPFLIWIAFFHKGTVRIKVSHFHRTLLRVIFSWKQVKLRLQRPAVR